MKYFIVKDCRQDLVPVTKAKYYYIKKHSGCYDNKFERNGENIRIQFQYKGAPNQTALDL